MKLTFRKIVDSQAYQEHAAAVSKANIVVATAVAIFVMIFRDWGFGLWWLLIIPSLWFAASLLVALPFTALKVATIATLSDKPKSARFGSAAVDTLNYIVLVPLTYFALLYVHQTAFAE